MIPTEENNLPNGNACTKFPLTKREIEIITLICREYSTKQIASELVISPFTVETHTKRIRKKFGVFTIVGVAVAAIQNKIITPALVLLYPSFLFSDLFEIFSPETVLSFQL